MASCNHYQKKIFTWFVVIFIEKEMPRKIGVFDMRDVDYER